MQVTKRWQPTAQKGKDNRYHAEGELAIINKDFLRDHF
jgi:hypothetical protein